LAHDNSDELIFPVLLHVGPLTLNSSCGTSSFSSESKSQEDITFREGTSSRNGGSIDYGLNGDNLDWVQRPSIYSSQRDTSSIHWFNLICYQNRVNDWELPDAQPIRPILDLPNSSFLPSIEEHSELRNDFIILVSRILVKYCAFFKQFAQMVPNHIPHLFSKEMKQQSQVVSYEINDHVISKILKLFFGFLI